MEEISRELIPVAALPLSREEMRLYLAGQLEESTIAMYVRDTRAYATWVRAHEMDPLSPQTLRDWRDDLVATTTMSPNTINRMLAAVKRLMKEAALRERISEEIEIKFSRVEGVSVRALRTRLKQHARVRIEPEEMRRMCQLADTNTLAGLRDAAMLATLASSGVRIEELVTLTWQHVKRRGKGYYVLVRGKTDVDYREAPLSHEAYEKLLVWKTRQPVSSLWVFTGFDGPRQIPRSRHISTEGAWKRIRRYAKQAELTQVKPHDFRRFVGTQLAKQDLRKAQVALGHKNIATTARHYVLDELEIGLTDHLY